MKTYFAVMDNEAKKFVSHVSNKGKVYLRKNPFNANYFISYGYAEAWRMEQGMQQPNFTVIEFTEKP
jgi:hypothetical protein